MLWPRRVRVGVLEHLERALALAHRKLERLTGLGVVDRHGYPGVVGVPKQTDLDPVARAAVELACDLCAWLCHLAVIPGRVIAMH
jgi:hypothetical protein